MTVSSKINVERLEDPFNMGLRACKVSIDGAIVGELRSGELDTYLVEPGIHQICIKIDWCKSNSVRLNCHGGNPYTLRFWPKNVISTLLGTFLPFLFHPITLEQVGIGEGYNDKTLQRTSRLIFTGLMVFVAAPEAVYWLSSRQSWSWITTLIFGAVGTAIVTVFTVFSRGDRRHSNVKG